MANYHTDRWFEMKLLTHYLDALETIPTNNIVVVAMQGSGNYGLDYENSDFDSKCIITPTFKDIVLNRKPISTTKIRANDEHIDLKDIRLYIETFRKQNLNFLEILFTKYYSCPRSDFKSQWQRLLDNREKIAHMNPLRGFASMKGIAAEKYHALEHHYPSRMEWINKYGYDGKQLHHLLRIHEFMQRFYAGESYQDCLISKQAEYLIEVKKNTYYTLEKAREIAQNTMASIEELYNAAKNILSNEENSEMRELLEDVSYNIMKISVIDEVECDVI